MAAMAGTGAFKEPKKFEPLLSSRATSNGMPQYSSPRTVDQMNNCDLAVAELDLTKRVSTQLRDDEMYQQQNLSLMTAASTPWKQELFDPYRTI